MTGEPYDHILRSRTAWLRVRADTSLAGVSRFAYINLGAGPISHITVAVHTLHPGESRAQSIATLHHPGGTTFFDNDEADTILHALEAIAARPTPGPVLAAAS